MIRRPALLIAAALVALDSCNGESPAPLADARLEALVPLEARTKDTGPPEARPVDRGPDQAAPDLKPGPTCVDGTPVGTCSKTKPLRCASSLKLEHDCPICNCEGFQACNKATKDCEPVTVTLTATADSYVVEPAPTENHGTEPSLKVGRAWNGLSDTLVNFDLSTIPAKATIDSATLRLDVVGWGGTPIPATIALVTSPWAEAQVTWATAPVGSSTIKTSHTFGFGANSVDAKSLVAGWMASPVAPHGFRIKVDSTQQGSVTLASREHGTATQRPRLVITYR